MILMLRNIVIAMVIVMTLMLTAVSATEISGTLRAATQDYIVVDRGRYPVTDRTIIVDRGSPGDTAPYSPLLLRRDREVTLIIEHGRVKEVLIEVPK